MELEKFVSEVSQVLAHFTYVGGLGAQSRRELAEHTGGWQGLRRTG